MLDVTKNPSVRWPVRMWSAIHRQRDRSIRCPDTPRLDGKRVLVTGGNNGVGLATCRGLLRRGASVVMASRNQDKAARACAQLREETGRDTVWTIPLDLSDLSTVPMAIEALDQTWGDAPLDAVVFNAGIWPQRYATSAQGYEVAFATNVLGHHVLFRHLRSRLPDDARVVVLTGDIYIVVDDCTPAFRGRGPRGGMQAYCRAKLGNLWWSFEAQRRQPNLRVVAVHPGVVASDLGGDMPGFVRAMRERLLLSLDEGAQCTLYALTQGDVPHGGYIHNTLGIMKLSPRDPGGDDARAAGLWTLCEQLGADYLS